MERYNKFNNKRRIKKLTQAELQHCGKLAERVKYGGNPEHKKNPGDFNLSPPTAHRRGKSLCDQVSIFTRKEALEHLRAGLRKGLVSERHNGEWPQNIWSVTNQNEPLEAQLENPQTGAYHGYPMPESDPLASEIKRIWKRVNRNG